MAEEQPVIYFRAYEIKDFKYRKNDVEESDSKDQNTPFSISVNPNYDDQKDRAVIKVHVLFKNNDISLDITVNGYFELMDGKKDNFEKYLVINGTAMVFPYIRSMVSMLTSLDNENAIVLPTINTYSLWKDNKN